MCNSYVTVLFLSLGVLFDWQCHLESAVSETNTNL